MSTRNSQALPAKRRRVPPLKSLLAFEAAARHGNFTRAAEELGLTPSAISHHIQSLEEFVGVKLFRRGAGQVTLTGAGDLYWRDLEKAFRLIGEATERIAPQAQDVSLVIASGPSFAAKWLQPRLPLFIGSHPGVKIRLSTFSDPAQLADMRFDVAISYRRPSLPAGDFRPMIREFVRPLCSPALASVLKLRQVDDLARATLIHSENVVTWEEFIRRHGMNFDEPVNQLWLDRSAMAIEAAENGLGVILESDILTRAEQRKAG
ncbi:MAG: LysR family transcriptional regulator [Zavarzinia sp.]|nr:LysR family transcriptional regulator [Zavarzinia sp.]